VQNITELITLIFEYFSVYNVLSNTKHKSDSKTDQKIFKLQPVSNKSLKSTNLADDNFCSINAGRSNPDKCQWKELAGEKVAKNT
jgi:hypothetical protein